MNEDDDSDNVADAFRGEWITSRDIRVPHIERRSIAWRHTTRFHDRHEATPTLSMLHHRVRGSCFGPATTLLSRIAREWAIHGPVVHWPSVGTSSIAWDRIVAVRLGVRMIVTVFRVWIRRRVITAQLASHV
jgi:hypothetical protein